VAAQNIIAVFKMIALWRSRDFYFEKVSHDGGGLGHLRRKRQNHQIPCTWQVEPAPEARVEELKGASKVSFRVFLAITFGSARIPGDSWRFLEIPVDSSGFLWIPGEFLWPTGNTNLLLCFRKAAETKNQRKLAEKHSQEQAARQAVVDNDKAATNASRDQGQCLHEPRTRTTMTR